MLLFYFLLTFGVIMLPRYIKYKGSAYKIASGNSFIKTVFDKGNYGEFLTFNKLEKLKGHNKLMTNLYTPKEDGSTTEVDLIMISETGIYVFESKNYSGWIFGDENQKNWTQTLQNKQKNKFFNPIWQNNGHISALKSAVGIDDENLYKSYIIFSERCTLKKVNVTSKNIKVIKRNSFLKHIKRDLLESEKILNIEQIDGIYEKLGKYCLADDKLKQAHIDEIKLKKVNKF
ncbi:nuclease-related domain-containing protein [Globicatella sulfidifaciens]|uniref:NERD domain-containing protein n=1 Tax=Globicatella sulfidifaciens TaxID=136093 RepID=A0A7X8GZZ2_9LACT|nr:nuclease-related domain-containing protein [Globicatella sulfidifaciens]NLJ18314.1 NERD domain-containing protein [Globicatella sulfidifaciens]